MTSCQHSCAKSVGGRNIVAGRQTNATHIMAGEASWRINHFRTKGRACEPVGAGGSAPPPQQAPQAAAHDRRRTGARPGDKSHSFPLSYGCKIAHSTLPAARGRLGGAVAALGISGAPHSRTRACGCLDSFSPAYSQGVQGQPPHQSKARAAMALDGMAWARLAARLLLLLLGVQPGEQASRMRVASCRLVDRELGKHVCAIGLHAFRE